MKLFLIIIICCTFLNYTNGQLCSGSLGDPVVNITFGSGSNPGQPLGSSITNYNFVTTGCPNDGNYTIVNSSISCFNNTWHPLSEDHTPDDAGGYMMIVNASHTPGDFYIQTVTGLCGGTTYEFASWILNVERLTACGGNPIKPNVTFNIETTSGTVLLTSKTGDIPSTNSPEWKQYGAYFTTPQGISTVVIRMTNNAPGGCGNDLVLDDITFRPCGPKVTANISGSADIKDVCKGDSTTSVLISNISNGYSNQSYQWQVSTDSGNRWTDIAGATSNTYTRPATSTAGTFLYRLAVAQGTNIGAPLCRIASNIITINVNNTPVPAASNSGPFCEGDVLKLNAGNSRAFQWTGPNNFSSSIQSPVINNASISNSGKYYVKVTSDKGCTSTDSTTVIINKSPVANAGRDTIICEGTSVQLQGTGANAMRYLWTPSTGLSSASIPNPFASPTNKTAYILTVSTGTCKSSDTILINVLKKPTAEAGPNKRIMQGDSVVLNGSATGENLTYTWAPSFRITGSTTLQPVVRPTYSVTYVLNVMSSNGCGAAIDTVNVKVFEKLHIPNAFSPNNDGINDTWNISGLWTFPSAQVSIFNRYGQLVFRHVWTSRVWDGLYNGKPLPIGVYYYIIDRKEEGFPLISGSIMLLR